MSPPTGPVVRRLMQAVIVVMIAAAAASWVLVPWREPLAIAAIVAAIAGPFLRLGLVAATWRGRADRPYLAGACALIFAVALMATLR